MKPKKEVMVCLPPAAPCSPKHHTQLSIMSMDHEAGVPRAPSLSSHLFRPQVVRVSKVDDQHQACCGVLHYFSSFSADYRWWNSHVILRSLFSACFQLSKATTNAILQESDSATPSGLYKLSLSDARESGSPGCGGDCYVQRHSSEG